VRDGIAPIRWKVVCAYDGTRFSGWQSQSNGLGIQDCIEARIAEVIKSPVRIHGSGRTDAGVHAHGQVFHFDAAWSHGPAKLKRALEIGLPATIQLKSLAKAAAGFHARFSAVSKRYVYRIVEGDTDPFSRPFVWRFERAARLDLVAMQVAATTLRGTHDFTAFSANTGAEVMDAVRTITRLDIIQRGRSLKFVFEADGFLYKMVRSLVGALVGVGEGRLAPADLQALFGAPKRTKDVSTAPAKGLFLDRVFYPAKK
jgi:tRNA pseudouridine38-40 synthase